MAKSDKNNQTLPVVVILSAVLIFALALIFIRPSGNEEVAVTNPDSLSTEQDKTSDTSGDESQAPSGNEDSDAGEADQGLAGTSGNQDQVDGADNLETTQPPASENLPVAYPLPDNWHELSPAEKEESNPHKCWEGTLIRADNGRCFIAFGAGLRAEYIRLATERPQSYDPIPEGAFVTIAVPDTASEEQIDKVFENYISSTYPRRVHFGTFIVLNYGDVTFDSGRLSQFGWTTTGGDTVDIARKFYEIKGQSGIRFDYLGTKAWEAGRDGANLPDDCLALDLSFAILSHSGIEQLRKYYSRDGDFHNILDENLGYYGYYEWPDHIVERVRAGDFKYDVLIKLYQGDPGDALRRLRSMRDYSEADRLQALPEISINYCQ